MTILPKPIFVPLCREPFEKFRRGTKSVEIRQRGSPVANQVVKRFIGDPVVLSFGFGKARRLYGYLGSVFHAGSGIDGLPRDWLIRADLDEASEPKFFSRDEPIIAFEVRGVSGWKP